MSLKFRDSKTTRLNVVHVTRIKDDQVHWCHYSDVIMGMMASQITNLMIIYSTFYSGTDQRNHQSSASLDFVWGIHQWPVNSPHIWTVTRKMILFDDVIMLGLKLSEVLIFNWLSLAQIWFKLVASSSHLRKCRFILNKMPHNITRIHLS